MAALSSSLLQWIQEWFVSQCDGDWEHSKGIKIDTLDNPGWEVQIDILQNLSTENVILIDERNASEWIFCRIENGLFLGYGSPRSLERILEQFKVFVEINSIR